MHPIQPPAPCMLSSTSRRDAEFRMPFENENEGENARLGVVEGGVILRGACREIVCIDTIDCVAALSDCGKDAHCHCPRPKLPPADHYHRSSRDGSDNSPPARERGRGERWA